MTEVRELPSATVTWQSRRSSWLATVVCKITFRLRPGELDLSPHQEPLVTHDAFWDDDPSRSLIAATDIVPSKPRADVVLLGSGFSPGGKPVPSLVARLRFESIDKSIELVADRSVGPDGTIFQGARFSRMPISYERSFGGPGTWNPVGVRANARDAYGRVPLPTIVPVGKPDLGAGEPIGFGPIAPSWSLRAKKLGHHEDFFLDRGWTKLPVPDGADLGFFNIAPPDQQIEAIPDNAPLLLENLHHEHGVLDTRLPGVRPRVTVQRHAGAERPTMRADTLVIDTDRGLLFVTWRGHIQIDGPDEALHTHAQPERSQQSWRTALNPTSDRQPSSFANEQTSAGIPESVRSPVSNRAFERSPSRTAPRTPGLPFASALRVTQRTPSLEGTPFAQTGPQVAAPSVPPPMPPAAPVPIRPPAPTLPDPLPPPAPAAPPPMPMSAPAPMPMSAPAPLPMSAPAPLPMSAPVPGPPMASVAWPAPPSRAVTHTPAATMGGVVSASNAAADPAAKHAAPAPRVIEGDVLSLLWFDKAVVPRLRRRDEYKALLAALADRPIEAGDEKLAAEDPAALEDRRDVYEVLARATPDREDAVDRALVDAVRSDGRFAARLVLLAGEARFDFDELETLKATVSTAAPFQDKDEPLKATLEEARKFLATPGVVAAPDVCNSIVKRIREAFTAAKDRPVAATYLDDQTERALLDKRAYQRRLVFGDRHLRCLFFPLQSTTGIPAYLPDEVSKKLPLFRNVKLRGLFEVHFQTDQYEEHSAALKGVAAARIVR